MTPDETMQRHLDATAAYVTVDLANMSTLELVRLEKTLARVTSDFRCAMRRHEWMIDRELRRACRDRIGALSGLRGSVGKAEKGRDDVKTARMQYRDEVER